MDITADPTVPLPYVWGQLAQALAREETVTYRFPNWLASLHRAVTGPFSEQQSRISILFNVGGPAPRWFVTREMLVHVMNGYPERSYTLEVTPEWLVLTCSR